MRDCKRCIHTQKIRLADNKHRLKIPVSLAVNEMQGFSTIKLTVILKDCDARNTCFYKSGISKGLLKVCIKSFDIYTSNL